MDDALLVRFLEAPRRSACAMAIASSSGIGAALQPIGEVLALDQLHRDDVDRGPVVEGRGLEAVELRDARMVERSEQPGLAVEAGEALGVGGEGLGQQLERDLAPEPRVGRAVHLAHARRRRSRR